jgi:hypothetical protein
MAIEYGPGPGYGALIGQLATKAGQGRVAAEQRATAADFAKLNMQLENQQAMAQAERTSQRQDLEMRLNFEKELKKLDYDMELQKAATVKQWDIEKMQIRSQLDFETEEKARLAKQQEVETKLSAIDRAVESGKITETQGKQQKANFYASQGMQQLAYQESQPKTMQEILADEYMKAQQGKNEAPKVVTGSVSTNLPASSSIAEEAGGVVVVKNSDGNVVPVNPHAEGYLVLDTTTGTTYKVTDFNGLSGAISEKNMLYLGEVGSPSKIPAPKTPIVNLGEQPIGGYRVASSKRTSESQLDKIEKTWKDLVKRGTKVTDEFAGQGLAALNSLNTGKNSEQIKRIRQLIVVASTGAGGSF